MISGSLLPNFAKRPSRKSSITPPLRGKSSRMAKADAVGGDAGAPKRKRRLPEDRQAALAGGAQSGWKLEVEQEGNQQGVEHQRFDQHQAQQQGESDGSSCPGISGEAFAG